VSTDAGSGPTDDVTVVVLAGGTSRRFGSDKLAAPLHGSTVLDTLLASLPPGWPVVVVGPPRECGRAVTWAREDPPGGGPLAGVAAGVSVVVTDLVAVVAGDMPFAGHAVVDLVTALRTAPPEVGAVVAVDPTARVNPLLAAYRTAAVRSVLPDAPGGLPARNLLGVAHVEVVVAGAASRGVDTLEDLHDLRGQGPTP
jgi:molybdopterin-guanine dinucleotide biosynthesis protein A